MLRQPVHVAGWPAAVCTRPGMSILRHGPLIWNYALVLAFIQSCSRYVLAPLQWWHNDRNGVSNHQPHDCLLGRLSGRRSKKSSKLCVSGLCAGNSPVTGEFPALRASNAENVSIWWRHHERNASLLPQLSDRLLARDSNPGSDAIRATVTRSLKTRSCAHSTAWNATKMVHL